MRLVQVSTREFHHGSAAQRSSLCADQSTNRNFYEDIFEELGKYGELESLNVCDNLADHMVGNVYIQFHEEEQAAAVLQADISTNGR
ncbi:hypothetical protein R1flu_006449 [Riccia fluitans]|uniref:RRM domain-containing protein n=1 Tax=Riccia fluitans TaxID=41844 RepID=A0ABD1YW22_9MARC